MKFKDVQDVQDRLTDAGYISYKEMATVVFI